MATIQKLERKNGARYRVLIRRAGHKPITKVFDKKKAAETWARVMEGDLNNVDDFPDADARRHTVANAIDGFVRTYEGKDGMVLARLAWWRSEYGNVALSRFGQSTIREGLDRLSKQPAKRSAGKGKSQSLERPKSKATINRYHGAISVALRWATNEAKWITRNPALGITRKREPNGRTRYLSDDERRRLLTACDASSWPDLGLLVRIALSTGARLSEALKLDWRDIDLARCIAYLADTKNSEPRALPLVTAVLEMLKRKPEGARTGLVFPAGRKDGQPFAFRAVWNEAVKAAELENFRFHDLRHSCASYLAMSGASTVQIADVLGHKTLAMVKRYSHLNTAHRQELLERVTGGLVAEGK